MTHQLREFHRPAEAAEAAALLHRAAVPALPLALGPRVPDHHLAGAEAAVDLSRLGLDAIEETAAGVVRVGGSVSLQALVDSALLRSLAGGIVSDAALLACGSAMRHAATLGGTLLHARRAAAGEIDAGPPELLLSLLVLDAQVRLQPASAEPASLDLASYLADGKTGGAGLLLDVSFQRPPASARGALARVARTPRDHALVAAAALVDGAAVRLAVAAGGADARRLPAVEQALAGAAPSPELLAQVERGAAASVEPASDFRASSDYRRAMSGVLVRRALAAALRGRAARQE